MATPREALRRTFEWRAVRRALSVAAIIGTILNGINQGDAILGGERLVVRTGRACVTDGPKADLSGYVRNGWRADIRVRPRQTS